MARYLISFDAHAMDHIPEADMPAVAEASHAVVFEAMDAGVSFLDDIANGANVPTAAAAQAMRPHGREERSTVSSDGVVAGVVGSAVMVSPRGSGQRRCRCHGR